jgi:hypothetical protein
MSPLLGTGLDEQHIRRTVHPAETFAFIVPEAHELQIGLVFYAGCATLTRSLYPSTSILYQHDHQPVTKKKEKKENI